MKLSIFSHGKESTPNGNKIRILRKVAEHYGFETIALDYTKCANASLRVDKLRDYINTRNAKTLVLIGSSMGGYVSTVLANEVNIAGLFLMCPAIYMPENEYKVQKYSPKCKNIEIIHGWNDTVVPYENSIKFGQQTKATLNLVDDNHRLINSYAFIEKRFKYFMKNVL